MFRKHSHNALTFCTVAISGYVAISASSQSTVFLTAIRLLVFFLIGAMFNFSPHKFTWVILVTIGLGEMIGEGSLLILNALLISLILFVVLPSGEGGSPPSRPTLPGDYSYGIYIWHWPILQTIFAAEKAIGVTPNWFVSLVIASPLVALVAVASWHLLERPSLLIFKRS